MAKLEEKERRELSRLIKKAAGERDLQKFQAALLKLGYVETSAEYAKLMQLWGEFWAASRHD
jgi:hypothetical protein